MIKKIFSRKQKKLTKQEDLLRKQQKLMQCQKKNLKRIRSMQEKDMKFIKALL